MDLKTIERCFSPLPDLEREYGGGFAEDDCRPILHNFQVDKNFCHKMFLQDDKGNDKGFPIGFILNTGDHSYGGFTLARIIL